MKFKRILPFLFVAVSFISCTKNEENKAIIWTDIVEFASYAELFNATHADNKVVVVYKKDPAMLLPPEKNEIVPDIVIGSWLKNADVRKNFKSVDFFFDEEKISKNSFYRQLLDYGRINDKQYLLPVCFNLPAVIYDRKNAGLLSPSPMITVNAIMDKGIEFNRKNKNGNFTAIGFSPVWFPDFMYIMTKLNGASYMQKGVTFSWNDEAVKKSVDRIMAWGEESGVDSPSAQNFQFRYLYMPGYRSVSIDRCLFAYMNSNGLFSMNSAQSANISFKWISQDGRIPIEDDIVTLGIYRKLVTSPAAEEFIAWFMQEENQVKLLERTKKLNLDTINFGIAGGFSSLKDVNEKSYPALYRELLGNLPPADYLSVPDMLPVQWMSLKTNVIIPYLVDRTSGTSTDDIKLENRVAEWSKQFY